MLKFFDGQTDRRTDVVITIGHPPSGGALIIKPSILIKGYSQYLIPTLDVACTKLWLWCIIPHP